MPAWCAASRSRSWSCSPGYLLLRRSGWRPVVALALGWAVIVGGYASIYHVQHGAFALTQSDGRFLYARTARLADCAQLGPMAPAQRSLCPDLPHRLPANSYLWGRRSPIYKLGVQDDARIRAFAVRVIRDRPLAYAHLVARDVVHYFKPGHRIGYDDYSNTAWQFPADPRRIAYPGFRGPIRPGTAVRHPRTSPGPYVNAMVGRPRMNVSASRLLHRYQRWAFTPGPVLASCLLVTVAALIRSRGGARRLALDAALLGASTLVALLMTSALALFNYRYGLIAVILLPAAAALAITSLLQTRARDPPTATDSGRGRGRPRASYIEGDIRPRRA
jgi:hypothetical protein